MFENKSILEITSLIKSKEILVKDVVEFYLERIKKYNPALNAIVLQKEEEQIFHEINLKDKEDNKSKPLFGLPLACKDLFDIEGIPSTYGFLPYKNNIAKKNSSTKILHGGNQSKGGEYKDGFYSVLIASPVD